MKIKIVNPVDEKLKYYINDVEDGIIELKNEIHFPRETKKRISFFSFKCNKEVPYGLSLNIYDTKFFKFEEIPFNREELISLSLLFSFEITNHKLHKESLVGSLGFVHKDYEGQCKGAIQKCNDLFFLVVYASRESTPARCAAEDFFGDDIYYIHGIWQIELSEDFKEKMYS